MLWCFIVAFCLSDNLVLTRKHDSVSPEHTTIRPIHGFTEVLKESPLRNSKLAEVQPIINLKEARLGVACPIKHYVWRGNCDVVWSYSFIPKWPSCLKSMLPKIPALVYTYTYIHKYTLNMYIYNTTCCSWPFPYVYLKVFSNGAFAIKTPPVFWPRGLTAMSSRQLLAFEKPRVAVTSVNLAVDSPCHQAVTKWGWVKTNSTPGEHQNSWDLWMFIPLKMVLIGIDGIDP